MYYCRVFKKKSLTGKEKKKTQSLLIYNFFHYSLPDSYFTLETLAIHSWTSGCHHLLSSEVFLACKRTRNNGGEIQCMSRSCWVCLLGSLHNWSRAGGLIQCGLSQVSFLEAGWYHISEHRSCRYELDLNCLKKIILHVSRVTKSSMLIYSEVKLYKHSSG